MKVHWKRKTISEKWFCLFYKSTFICAKSFLKQKMPVICISNESLGYKKICIAYVSKN